MITKVHVSEMIDATPEAVFDCVADYAVAPLFIEGLQRLTPAGPSTTGEGARFNAVMKVGPSTFHATIEISEYVENRRVTWSSTNGQTQAVTFDLEPSGDGTKVVLEVTYERPSGISGALVAPMVDETVRLRANGALRRLKHNV
ncbi:MAG TPA: SRPBCC family protein [Acidimicrobiales bacterium]|nr:SRPBCC family protein [Acidimicrobiales bacterium]